ncbi:MAG: OsmC family peroxiredoxin [Chromatiaceae bacterium]|nr:OsmC family peroxiredoxin [Chromatiaceae bacterium]
MSQNRQPGVELTHQQGLEFALRFDQEALPPLCVGGSSGPGATLLVVAAAAQCLSASLLYCIAKNDPPPGSLQTRALCSMVRNPQGRQRIGSIAVTLEVSGELESVLRTPRCYELFEEFSTVAASLRQGFPVSARVVNQRGDTLYHSREAETDDQQQ